jgi:hypothetical protein
MPRNINVDAPRFHFEKLVPVRFSSEEKTNLVCRPFQISVATCYRASSVSVEELCSPTVEKTFSYETVDPIRPSDHPFETPH